MLLEQGAIWSPRGLNINLVRHQKSATKPFQTGKSPTTESPQHPTTPCPTTNYKLYGKIQ